MLNKEQIMEILPHRPPMLLVDEILEMDENHVVGALHLTGDEFFFQGHFPGNPIMPAVFRLEALAQAGGGVNFAGAQDEPLGLFQRFQRAQGQLLARACAQGDDGYLMHDGFNPFSALRGGAGGQADPRCARP